MIAATRCWFRDSIVVLVQKRTSTADVDIYHLSIHELRTMSINDDPLMSRI